MRDADRLDRYLRTIGVRPPPEYLAFLATHRVDPDGDGFVVSSDPEHWIVTKFFEIGDGPDFVQADETYRLVGDVLPNGMIPIAEDHGGNFFLLDCSSGTGVYWWDHERDLGDDRVEKVAGSFDEFKELLVPD